MKKILLGLIFTAALGLAQGTLSLVNPNPVPPNGYAAGSSQTINIVKTGNPNTTAIQFDVAASLGSGPLTVALGPAVPPGKLLTCGVTMPQRCLIFGFDKNVIPDGTVAVITDTLSATRSNTAATATLSAPVESDGNGTDQPTTVGSPIISYPFIARCDVNNDGIYSPADANMVAAKTVTMTGNPLVDMNNDGRTNVLDVQIAATAAFNGVCTAK